jgi:hypothetical protein
MAHFRAKNSDLGKFWMALAWKMFAYIYGDLEYFTAICYIL